ncbi:hypothetical protein Tco_0905057 [Tanacetum coccineum]
MGDGNVSLLPRHLDVPAPTAMHGQQRIQLSPATNVNITTTFSGMSYQTVDWGCYLLFQITRKPHVEGTKRREAIDC